MTWIGFIAALLLLWASAALAAAAFRPPSLAAFFVTAYAVASAILVALAEILSLGHQLEMRGYLIGETATCFVAASAWWLCGRPKPPRPVRPRINDFREHRLLLFAICVMGIAVLYEFVVGATTPPNNWDSLWYHLARVAAWHQQHAVSYIEPVNNELLNAYPPNGEMQIFFAMLPGSETFATVPQLFAELALIVAIYGMARRLGFERPAAAFASFLFSTLSVVALESVTTQNDLCAAAGVAAATFFIIGKDRRELPLAGVAIALAVGTKLTGLIALPVLALVAIAARRRRREIGELVLWTVVAIAALGTFGYALNLANTGKLGGDETDTLRAHLSLTNSISTIARTLYRFVDLSGMGALLKHGTATIALFALALATAGVTAAAAGRRTRTRGITTFIAVAASLICVPIAMVGLALLMRGIITLGHVPLAPRGATANPFRFTINTRANEDLSYFGPLGVFLIWPTAIGVLVRRRNGRYELKAIALAASLPVFLITMAGVVRYSLWIGRFLVIPVALVMPLCATVYERRRAATLTAVIGTCVLALTLVFDEAKPTGIDGSRPIWSLSRSDAESLMRPSVRPALALVDTRIPRGAHVGVLLWPRDWSYPIYGSSLDRHVDFLDHPLSPKSAAALGLTFVIEHQHDPTNPTGSWRITPLADPSADPGAESERARPVSDGLRRARA